MRQIRFIVLHCTAGPQTQSLASIRNWWRSQGWVRPGYHRLIAADGQVHELAPYSEVTNGVLGHNAHSIHISYIGGVANGRPVDNRTPAQRQAMRRLVEEAADLFPEAIILGHRDFAPDKNRDGEITPDEWMKSCPSFSVKAWLDEIGFKGRAPKKLLFVLRAANIRTGPGTAHPTAGPALAVGTQVQVIGSNGGWFYVQAGMQKGWVSGSLLSREAAATDAVRGVVERRVVPDTFG